MSKIVDTLKGKAIKDVSIKDSHLVLTTYDGDVVDISIAKSMGWEGYDSCSLSFNFSRDIGKVKQRRS